MRKLFFSQLSWDDLATVVEIEENGIDVEVWAELDQGELTDTEQRMIRLVTDGLQRIQPSLVNEATVWGRAIFPLLLLAETERIVAQADVPLSARIGDVELTGSADGAFGTPVAGELRAPFLIVVEAKRGVEGYNPVTQLYGELLAAAQLNARKTGRHAQRMYGSYTIGDHWTFVRADLEGLDAARPRMAVASSTELSEKVDAASIVKILKSIVARHAAEIAAR